MVRIEQRYFPWSNPWYSEAVAGRCRTHPRRKLLYGLHGVLPLDSGDGRGIPKISESVFPSKNLEYLAAGRPVICARLPGIPEEYFGYLQLVEDETPDGLTEIWRRCRDMPADQRRRLGDLGKSFVLAQKTEAKQGLRLREFLGSLGARSAASKRIGLRSWNSARSRHSSSAR